MVLDAFVRAKIEAWRDHESEPDLVSELDRLICSHDEASLYDAFYRDLSFGTAGIRGIMGVGTNRMNVHVVAQTMQGIADWINSSKAGKADSNAAPSVVLCRDSRINSERFERICAETFAANNIHVWLYPALNLFPLFLLLFLASGLQLVLWSPRAIIQNSTTAVRSLRTMAVRVPVSLQIRYRL